MTKAERPPTFTIAIGRFAKSMRYQMRRNSDKHGWAELAPEWCFKRALEEMGELAIALKRGHKEEIRSEAADAANFLMMLHHALGREP